MRRVLLSRYTGVVSGSRGLSYHSSRAPRGTPNPLPATFLRGGTSKGLYINRYHLPEDVTLWARIFRGMMGSPDPEHQRQLNGMGGGVSSLSKVIVVGKPSDALAKRGVDAEYTFAQVGVADGVVDYSGNCGNLTSVVGAFAVDEGLCSPRSIDGRVTVRTFNTNTSKIIDLTFPAAGKNGTDSLTSVLDLEEVSIAGVPGKASRIILDFPSPSGARTGKLFPSGNPVDVLSIAVDHKRDLPEAIPASLVDATNPAVFVSYPSLRALLPQSDDSPISFSDTRVLSLLETIRQVGAERMGLDPSAQAQPKIAVLSSPTEADRHAGVDIRVDALSMGVHHRAVPLTVGMCLGVAASVEGTIARNIVTRTQTRQNVGDGTRVRIAHPSGLLEVGTQMDADGTVKSANVVRTGRKLMKGVVWW